MAATAWSSWRASAAPSAPAKSMIGRLSILISCRVSARREGWPQRLRPCLCKSRSDLLAPIGLAAEIAPPHPEPARVVVQDMLVGEAHRAHRLVRDRRDALGELRALALGRSDRKAAAIGQPALVGV